MKKEQAKMKAVCLLTWLCVLGSLPAWGNRPKDFDYKKQKEIVQSFRVGSSDLLQVDNRYGNITVTHWNKNEVEIRVKIEARANREEVAQRVLDRVSIELKKEGGVVSGVTSFKSQNSWSESNDNQSLTIDYFISMPSALTSDLSQKYGNINLPQQNDGKCTLHIKYGNLNAGNFSKELDLEAKYGNVNMGHLSEARLEVGYVGNMTCKDVKILTIDSKYSKLDMGKIHQLQLEEKYGNFTIVSLDRGLIALKYGDGTIGFLKDELDIDNLGYGSITLKEVSSSFTHINAEARYGNLYMKIPEKTAFTVEAENMKYGNYTIDGFHVTSSDSKERAYYRSEINAGGSRSIHFNGNNYSNLTIEALTK